MRINGKRLYNHIKTLGGIGYEPELGTTRMAYSETFHEGRDYVKHLMEQAGMQTMIDGVGNLTGRIGGKSKQIISIGSHIDTVPNGGMFDGALGVLAGIEAIQTLRENGYQNHYSMEVIAFTEEEGNVIGGTFGSKAFAGVDQEEDVMRKISFYGMDSRSIQSSKRSSEDYKCYLELHIEQGGVLEANQIPIGVVEGIFGIARYKVTVCGKSNHAGSTPMNLREDALVKASQMILRMIDICKGVNSSMTCTVGKLSVEPGVVNVIPGMVEFCVELRCLDMGDIQKAVDKFMDEFCSDRVSIERFLWQRETEMDSQLKNLLGLCCQEQKIPYIEMPSGAGHDSINMALFTPTAMLFIPSVDGISHSILEKSEPEDMERGTNLLLEMILKLEKL
ncbi:putative uncharacterized protein [Blautia hydrogenotrophica CAG:147]|uniref:Zn-dependent hydrolase n=1 Tax=Blautia hydrogenotrophica TaxID=53443 RepID=UPI00033C98D4|nr:Zn-dependent hydrolase [Blautia hydrogenotrophica]CCX60408.1 putative uncharacterized protein [Blautia hydrogenotrophica CAG:147]